MTIRQDKVSGLIKKLVATFLEYETNKISLITITRCDVSKDLKKGIIFITVFPEERESQALTFVKRKRKDLREYLKKNMRIRRIPFLDIKIDEGEKNRQLIENITKSR